MDMHNVEMRGARLDSADLRGLRVEGLQAHAARDMVTAICIPGRSRQIALPDFHLCRRRQNRIHLTTPAGTKQVMLDPEETLLRR
jgi:hypothetical protein